MRELKDILKKAYTKKWPKRWLADLTWQILKWNINFFPLALPVWEAAEDGGEEEADKGGQAPDQRHVTLWHA